MICCTVPFDLKNTAIKPRLVICHYVIQNPSLEIYLLTFFYIITITSNTFLFIPKPTLKPDLHHLEITVHSLQQALRRAPPFHLHFHIRVQLRKLHDELVHYHEKRTKSQLLRDSMTLSRHCLLYYLLLNIQNDTLHSSIRCLVICYDVIQKPRLSLIKYFQRISASLYTSNILVSQAK